MKKIFEKNVSGRHDMKVLGTASQLMFIQRAEQFVQEMTIDLNKMKSTNNYEFRNSYTLEHDVAEKSVKIFKMKANGDRGALLLHVQQTDTHAS